MQEQTKMEIVAAMELYLDEKNLSQGELAGKCGVNASYIINMRKRDFNYKSGTKSAPIADKWFNRIAQFIGFSTEKNIWETRPTIQMKGILAGLNDAKENGEITVITGETGCGKTYITKLFAQKYPTDVFIVTVGSSDNISDLIDKVLAVLNVTCPSRSKSSRIQFIKNTMKKKSEDGSEPVLAFDESEYMKQPALCALKELYDALNTWCALVLIGTDQLLDNIEKLRKKKKTGIPQLYRRIKYRIIRLPAIDRTFSEFLKDIDPNLRKWLQKNCENYGELHDVLVKAKRESEHTNQPLTEEFVKMILRIG